MTDKLVPALLAVIKPQDSVELHLHGVLTTAQQQRLSQLRLAEAILVLDPQRVKCLPTAGLVHLVYRRAQASCVAELYWPVLADWSGTLVIDGEDTGLQFWGSYDAAFSSHRPWQLQLIGCRLQGALPSGQPVDAGRCIIANMAAVRAGWLRQE